MNEKKLVKFENMMSYVLMVLLVSALMLVFTSCGTTKTGGCGGNPYQEGY